MEAFVGFMEFMAFALFLYVICYFISKPMVKKRKLLAKRFTIGKDYPGTVETLTNVAKEVLANETVLAERIVVGEEKEEYKITTTVTKGKVSSVRVETSRTEIIVSEDGSQYINQKAFSEKGATLAVAFYLELILIVEFWFISFFLYFLLTCFGH